MEENIGARTQPRKTNLLKIIKEKIQKKLFTDKKVFIDNEVFFCHSIILAVFSNFFKQRSKEDVVFLSSAQIAPETFSQIYNWLILNKEIEKDNIIEIFIAVEFLEMPCLRQHCWNLIASEYFAGEKAYEIYLKAKKYKLKRIAIYLITKLDEMFLNFVASEHFLSSSLQEICALLSSCRICISSEMQVCLAAIRWLSVNWTKQQSYIKDVLDCVKFKLISPIHLLHFVRNENLPCILNIIKNDEFQIKIKEYFEPCSSSTEIFSVAENQERCWVDDFLWDKYNNTAAKKLVCFSLFTTFLEEIEIMGNIYWRNFEKHFEKSNS